MAVLDTTGRVAVVNAAAEQVHGIPRERLSGEHYLDLLPEDRRLPSSAEFARTVERGETAHYVSAYERGGERIETRVLLTPIRRGGLVVGALVVNFDEHAALPPPARASVPDLAPRRYQVLTLLAKGLSTAAIASALGLSTETVRNHVRAVLKTFGVRSRLEAVVAAENLGLIQLGNPDSARAART